MSASTGLKNHFPQSGKVEWIGLRRSLGKEMVHVHSAELLQGHGLVGDKAGRRLGGSRQITLMQAEYLSVIASFLSRKTVSPYELRRNIVVSGVNLGILRDCDIGINDAVIRITGNCAPCTKMEQALGYGGFNAMRNHGGVTAIVLADGMIRIGDEVEVLQNQTVENQLI